MIYIYFHLSPAHHKIPGIFWVEQQDGLGVLHQSSRNGHLDTSESLSPQKKTAVNSHSALLGGLFFFGVKVLPSKKKRSHVLGARPSGGWPNPNPPFAPHFAPAGTLAVSDLDPHSVVLHLSLVLTPWRLGMDSKWNELSASWWFTNFGPNGLRRSVCHVFSPMFRSEEKKPAIDKSYTFVCRTSFSMAGSSRTVVLHLHLRWAHLGATSDLAVQVGRWFESTR